MEITLKLYRYVDGVGEKPFPSDEDQVVISSFEYSADRMGGAPTITATVKHKKCLDDLWTSDVYAEFRGEKYYVMDTPSSSKSNDDERYSHEITLVSERETLNRVYFIDAVQGDSEKDKARSNSSEVHFFGDINEFVSRLNSCLKYQGLSYTAVVDGGVETEGKEVSFDDLYILEALQEIFNVYEIPYYFVGKVIHIGYTENTITYPLKYGFDGALLSISKENANYSVINKIKGRGSSDNIPLYYPNESGDREAIEAAGKKWITPMQNLMPSIYRESEGAEQFYEAKNNTYPDGEGGYYEFENEYSAQNQRQGTTDFEDIKPTIVGMTNASGQRIDMFSEFAYDLDDNDEVDEDGNYLHPYFFAKLRKFDGENGFNLFEQAIESQTMQFSFTSGVCGACTFELGVGEETNKNIVQVDDSGNLKRDKEGNVLWENQTPQDRQNDTKNYEVWIALKKDDSTYGQLMPNKTQNLRPSANDTFVILGITLPLAYITAAEKKLEQSLIKAMWESNKGKFTFSIKFSRIFFTEHPEVLEQLNENSRVLVEYNGQQHTLYVDSFTYRTDESSPLPEITVDLVDTLSIGQNSLQTQLDSVKQDILSSVGGGDFLKQGLKYFIRKDIADTAQGKITFNKGLSSKDDVIIGKDGFAGGLAGFGAKIDKNGRAEMRTLTLWESLDVPELRYNSVKVFLGIDWQVPGAGIIETCTPDTDAEGNVLDTGTCTLKLEQGQYGAIDVHDIALGIWHFGNETDATEDSDDGKGNFTFAGFATSYFRITEVSGSDNGTFRYALRTGFTVHPQPQMTFACYGNFNKEERQTSTYRTRTYTRRLWKQNTWEIGAQNIAMQDGDLSNLSIFGLNMTGYSMYVNSVYFTGVVSQVKPDGTPVRTANDRGAWQNNTQYDYYDRVSHNGCIWLCVNEDGTDTEPNEGNSNWLLEVSKGEAGQDGTSFKILGSKDDPSELPQSGNEVGDGYLIKGDLWVWNGTSWTNAGNIQGPAGESVKPLGNWYSGMTVPYLGVVRMGTATFMCTNKNGTTNPPLWIWTDKDTNRYIYSDGGYALTGEVNNTDYLIIAEDGTNAVSIIKVDVEYAIATSNTTAPTSGWQTDAPQWENGKYIWSRSVTYYSDGNKTITEAACISGGKGIKRIVEYYYRSTSATELIGGEWSTTCPEWINGTYIWTKSVIEYTDGTIDEEGEVNSTGAQGEGYTNMGHWYTDILVPKLGVVSMGGSSWTAKEATRNPPLWCWTDKDGNRFTYSDGYYSLTGEQNNSEYDLLAEKGDTGEDGKDGTDGEDGKDGKDGKGYEYIFKRTTTDSQPSTPTTSQTDDYVPSGWTDDPQGVSMTYLYEWVSKRTKTNGTWSSFSTPSIWAKYGETGKTGETGALARYRGVYNSSDTYIYDYENNVLVRDIVVYNGQAYQVKTRGDSVTGVTPSSTSSRWEQGSKFSFVATDTALIDNANVAGFIFRNLGFGSDGTPYGELRSQNTDSTGSPTLYMNTKTGYFYCSNATIQGALKAGSVGDFTINKGISNVEDNPKAFIEIEKNGGKFFRVNTTYSSGMCAIRADSATALEVSTYGSSSSSIGISVIANARGYGYAIRSSGNVLLNARQNEHVELYGLAINVRRVSSSGSLYSNDDFIEFANDSAITFNMSTNAVKGKVVYMKKVRKGADVTLTGSFRNPGDVGTSTSGRIGDEVSRMFVFDGTYWVQFYCG